MAFGDYDPTTIPGIEEENGMGIRKVSDFIEDFSYENDVRSLIDGLPIGSLLWWDMELDGDASLQRAKDYLQDVISSTEDIAVFAADYNLKAYPNPFSDQARIDFTLGEASTVQLAIYDALGRLVQTLAGGQLPSGNHSFEWNAAGRPGGIYYYVITLDGVSATGKLMLKR